MSTPISQREARRLRKRVEELERRERAQRNRWAEGWPGGVNIATLSNPSGELWTAVDVVRRLKHAVVVVADNTTLRFYACPLPEES